MAPTGRARHARLRRVLGSPRAWTVWTLAWLGGACAAFVVPALQATGDRWPAPLDDTYIYYGFARSLALGHPFAWFPGNGYSSGATSPLYPLLLAPGYALGLRGENLGAWACALAALCLWDLCRSLRAVLRDHPASWLAAPLVLAVPLLSWSWFSGMETALFGALLGRCLRAADRARRAPADRRRGAQLASGAWLGLCALTRPEAVALAIPLGLLVVRGAGSLATGPSLLRALAPLTGVLASQALINRLFTGEWSPAGAVRKAVWSNPYADGNERLIEVVKNAVVLLSQAFERALGGRVGLALLGTLLVAALWRRATRALTGALVLGAGGTFVLVCLNTTARFQNYRYAAAPLAMLLCGAALGAGALCRARRAWPLGLLLSAGLVVAPLGQLPRQRRHFAQASRNIVEQQGEIARRLRAMGARRVLVNDAGVIPYLSGVPPLDGLGLGGFRGLPFARASVHGPPAVIELIARLAPADRPDVLAVYPGWWGELVTRFGVRVDGVRIEGNVICGADEKVLYAADWSTLEPHAPPPGAIDLVDVGDLVDERAHRYRFPAPNGGWLIGPSGEGRYDAGRVVPPGQAESFVVGDVPAGPATWRLRTDAEGAAHLHDGARLLLRHERDGELLATPAPSPAHEEAPPFWQVTVDLPNVRAGDRLSVQAAGAPWRSFRHLLVRGEQL